jgi:hypothetical protein
LNVTRLNVKTLNVTLHPRSRRALGGTGG